MTADMAVRPRPLRTIFFPGFNGMITPSLCGAFADREGRIGCTALRALVGDCMLIESGSEVPASAARAGDCPHQVRGAACELAVSAAARSCNSLVTLWSHFGGSSVPTRHRARRTTYLRKTRNWSDKGICWSHHRRHHDGHTCGHHRSAGHFCSASLKLYTRSRKMNDARPRLSRKNYY